MSVLNWSSDPSGIWVVCDSLAGDYDTGKPRGYVAKAHVIPPLRALVCGTGISEFVQGWAIVVGSRLVARDLEEVSRYAPAILRQLWRPFRDLGETTTIYHFGAVGGQCCVHAFRSAADFEFEPLPHGDALKPAPARADVPLVDMPADLVRAALIQQNADRALPPSERVNVGGELFLYRIDPLSIGVRVVHRFADYDDTWARMIPGLRPL